MRLQMAGKQINHDHHFRFGNGKWPIYFNILHAVGLGAHMSQEKGFYGKKQFHDAVAA